jgi:hypothetical protein
MRRKRWLTAVGATMVVALLVACGGDEPATEAQAAQLDSDLVAPESLRRASSGARPIVVEVVETGSRSVADDHAIDDGGVSTPGAFFQADGYLYQRGTLTCIDGSCDGVVYDEQGVPSPEFPDQLIGRWICYGTDDADASDRVTGRLVPPRRCSTWALWWSSRPS